MTQIIRDRYVILDQILEILELSPKEREGYVESFEDTLLKRYVEAIAKKLPEQERKPMIALANQATTEEKKKELNDKVASWFNAEEIQNLFKKVSDSLFTELLTNAYKQATEEQKKKLAERFKIEVLRGS